MFTAVDEKLSWDTKMGVIYRKVITNIVLHGGFDSLEPINFLL